MGLCDAEVEQLRLAVERHHQVVRADIAVDDAEGFAGEAAKFVCVVKTVQRIAEDAKVPCGRKAALAREATRDPRHRPAINILHGHVVPTKLRVHLVQLHDVRMNEARGQARLFEEHGDTSHVVGELRLELLHGKKLVEAGRPAEGREVDIAHATASKLSDDVIPYRSRQQRPMYVRWMTFAPG